MNQALGLVSVVVREYDEAIAFYVGTLGFTLVEDSFVPEQNKRWVVVAPPGSTESRFLLARASNEEQATRVGNQTGGRVFLFLYTDDFARDYQAYRTQGVRFVRDPRDEPYGTVAVFADLYGNLWDLIQPSTPRRANPELWDAPDVVPAITYVDIPRAIEWLTHVFDFRERAEARLTWPGGGVAWMEVGEGLFSVSGPDPTWGDSPSGPAGFVMKVYVDDVDAHFARAKAEGARIVSEPEDGFWGGRVYRALDCEGHRWEISQRGRDLAAERWRLPPGVTRG